MRAYWDPTLRRGVRQLHLNHVGRQEGGDLKNNFAEPIHFGLNDLALSAGPVGVVRRLLVFWHLVMLMAGRLCIPRTRVGPRWINSLSDARSPTLQVNKNR